MAEINWTRESEIWLKDIYDFIAADDSEAAARTIINIYEKVQQRGTQLPTIVRTLKALSNAARGCA